MYPTGLEINREVMRIIQFDKNQKDIYCFGEVYAEKKIMDEKGVLLFDEAKRLLCKLFLDALKPLRRKLKKVPLAVSLPEEELYFSEIDIEIPENSKINLEQKIKDAADEHIPFDISTIYYDWQVIKKISPAVYRIAFTAAPKEIIESFLLVLQDSSCEVDFFEISSLALGRSLIPRGKSLNSCYCILSCGKTFSELAFFSHNRLIFTSTLPVYSKENSQTFFQKLTEVIKYLSLHEKIRKDFLFLLTGESGRIRMLYHEISKTFRAQTFLGEPVELFYNRNFESIPLINKEESLRFSVPIGLSLRSIRSKYQCITGREFSHVAYDLP